MKETSYEISTIRGFIGSYLLKISERFEYQAVKIGGDEVMAIHLDRLGEKAVSIANILKKKK